MPWPDLNSYTICFDCGKIILNAKYHISKCWLKGVNLLGYEYGDNAMPVNENINNELYTKFFNAEAQFLVSLSSLQEIDARIKELEMIAFEAKVRLGAATDKKRKVVANLTAAEREMLLTNKDLNVSDSLNAVKIRKSRMSSADQMAADMRKMNIPESVIAETIGKVMPEVKAEFKDKHDIVDKRKPEAIEPKAINTQASLLADITSGMPDSILSRNQDAAYKLARTVTHIAYLANSDLRPTADELNEMEALTINERYVSIPSTITDASIMAEVIIESNEVIPESLPDTSFNPFA